MRHPEKTGTYPEQAVHHTGGSTWHLLPHGAAEGPHVGHSLSERLMLLFDYTGVSVNSSWKFAGASS